MRKLASEGLLMFFALLYILSSFLYKYLPGDSETDQETEEDQGTSPPYMYVSSTVRDYLDDPSYEGTEWPVLVETSNNPYLIYSLAGVLEEEGIPFIVNEESPEMGGIANILLRDRLRVPEEYQDEARQALKASGIDAKQFIFFDKKMDS